MSLLSELNTLLDTLSIPVETGVFTGKAAYAGFTDALCASGDDADAVLEAERDVGVAHVRVVPFQAAMKSWALSRTLPALMPGLKRAEPMPKPSAPAAR